MKNKNYEPVLELAETVLKRCRADLERPLVRGSQGYIDHKQAQLDALRFLRPLCGGASFNELPDSLEDDAIKLITHLTHEIRSSLEIIAELSK